MYEIICLENNSPVDLFNEMTMEITMDRIYDDLLAVTPSQQPEKSPKLRPSRKGKCEHCETAAAAGLENFAVRI